MRRIIADDPDWHLNIVPCLSNLCLQNIISNFEERPTFEVLTPTQKDYVHERLSTSLNLQVTANIVSDGVYWKRCCEQRWDICDVSHYGNSWKRMFFERHLENIIELFIPDVTETKTVLDMIPLCKNYVKRLDISQLLPPIKEPQNEEEECGSDLSSDNEYDEPSMDHFDFNMLLSQLTNLEELLLVYRVKHCGMNFEWKMFEMTDRDCESLAKALKSCKTLKCLRIYESHIEDKKCRLLVKYLLDHPSLRELDFSHNLIGDGGARAVGKLLTRNEGGEALGKALLDNNTLLHLHLGANEVTGPTAIALSKVLFQNNTLRSINLSCNNLGVLGGKALEEAMSRNTSVTECDIRLTEVDEQSVSYINQAVWNNQSLEQKRRGRESKTK
ncbi:T-complex-associated testis-expressed protein 1 [Nibea albiflora]|uniref:T-complex-associated testis-expressed protein 1 n=1 Tax=Nibea albiflora TaxID=240163 RepID=A0ACB7FB84_NIBAL|nr:T-complex-associated testis-expressed protein 1 [Nibea albiflora]